MTENPKLARRLDMGRLEQSYGNLLEHFEKTNPSERRKTAALGWLGGLVLNLFLLALIILAVVLLRRQS